MEAVPRHGRSRGDARAQGPGARRGLRDGGRGRLTTAPTGTGRRACVALLLVAGLALLGCGDDGGSGSAANAVTKAATTPATTAPGATAVADACGLLTAAEVADRLGTRATRERDAGTSLDGHAFSQCRWTAGKRGIGIVVIASSARYDTHRKLPGRERVAGLGDAAIAREGTSLETAGATGGRTVTVNDGDRTLVVALDLGGTAGLTTDAAGTRRTRDDPVSTADVVGLARRALARLRSR